MSLCDNLSEVIVVRGRAGIHLQRRHAINSHIDVCPGKRVTWLLAAIMNTESSQVFLANRSHSPDADDGEIDIESTVYAIF